MMEVAEMARELSRRDFLRVAALVSGGTALAACAATPAPGAATTGAVAADTPAAAPVGIPRIRYLTDWYGGDRGELTSQFLGEFAEKFPDVATVSYEPAPEVGDRLLVEFAAGTAPDIFLWSFVDTPEFKEWLLDLKPFFEVDPEINEPDIIRQHPIFYENGQILALPFQGLFFGEEINVDLFEQAGLPMPWEHDHAGDKWWNWDDFVEAAVAINDLGEDIYGCTLGNDVDGPNWFQWVYSNGGSYWNPDTFETTLASNEATLEGMLMLNKLMCDLKVAIPFEDYSAMSESLGISPEAAGVVGIPRRLEERGAAAAEINVHRVGLARSPRTNSFMSNHNHQPNCISSKTQYQKEAWELGKYLASTEVQLAIGLNGTSQPCRHSAIESPEYFANQPAIAKEALVEQTQKGEFYPIFKGWREWRTEVRPIVEKMMMCEGDPVDALKEADEVGTAILKRYNEA